MIQINMYRTRTEGWKAEVLITEVGEPYKLPCEHRYETDEVSAYSMLPEDHAVARRVVLELANALIATHFGWPWVTGTVPPTLGSLPLRSPR